MNETATITITVEQSTVNHALNALEAAAQDEREPERYRNWFAAAWVDLQRANRAAHNGSSRRAHEDR